MFHFEAQRTLFVNLLKGTAVTVISDDLKKELPFFLFFSQSLVVIFWQFHCPFCRVFHRFQAVVHLSRSQGALRTGTFRQRKKSWVFLWPCYSYQIVWWSRPSYQSKAADPLGFQIYCADCGPRNSSLQQRFGRSCRESG